MLALLRLYGKANFFFQVSQENRLPYSKQYVVLPDARLIVIRLCARGRVKLERLFSMAHGHLAKE